MCKSFERNSDLKLLNEPFGVGRRVALIAVAATFVMLALLAIASRAHASETVYWDNYEDSPVTIAGANIDGPEEGSSTSVALNSKPPKAWPTTR